MAGMNALSAAARSIGGLSDDWHVLEFEHVPGGIIVEGAICPIRKRGPSKGKPNFKKPRSASRRRLFIAPGGG